MKMKRAKLSYAALIAVLSCLFFTASHGGATEESSSRQPRPCWKHRLWGLRMLDEGGVQCTTAAFINPYQIIMVTNGNNRQIITSSSAIHVEGKQKKSLDDMNADLEDEQHDKTASSLRRRSKDEWIDGQTMVQLMEMERAREEQERQRQLEMELFNNRFPQTPSSSQSTSSNLERGDKSQFVSRITYTDANTLQIELPPSGVDSNVFFSGAFSAMWFSAIAPATLGMLSGGVLPALFMAPFWLAGGVIAKTAIVDPFVSSKLTIGDFLWTIEKTYFRRIGKLTSKTKEGSTESLKGSSVEVGLVVNNVPRYELRLFFDGETLSFGSGLSYDELEYLSKTINEHCAEIAKNQKLQ